MKDKKLSRKTDERNIIISTLKSPAITILDQSCPSIREGFQENETVGRELNYSYNYVDL